jgi:hypothetical protein
MANPQQDPRNIERKDPNPNNPAKQAPSQDQSRNQKSRNPGNDQQGPQPENPADLGYDPKQPDTQAGGNRNPAR